MATDNLYVGYNKEENFRILIYAENEENALSVVTEYAEDTGMSGTFDVSEYDGVDTEFNCDYILADAQSIDYNA